MLAAVLILGGRGGCSWILCTSNYKSHLKWKKRLGTESLAPGTFSEIRPSRVICSVRDAKDGFGSAWRPMTTRNWRVRACGMRSITLGDLRKIIFDDSVQFGNFRKFRRKYNFGTVSEIRVSRVNMSVRDAEDGFGASWRPVTTRNWRVRACGMRSITLGDLRKMFF